MRTGFIPIYDQMAPLRYQSNPEKQRSDVPNPPNAADYLGKTSISTERRQGLPGGQKSLLCDLGCFFVLLKHAIYKIKNNALIALNKLSKRLLISVFACSNQQLVILFKSGRNHMCQGYPDSL